MTAPELQALLASPQPPRLIHVLPAEIFAATRIPGSQNACVYEMSFLDQVRTAVPDPSATIVVYGAGEGSLDAATAAVKLRATGLYAHVQPFEGGLAAWQAAGLPLEGTGLLPQPTVPDGPFRLDPAQSLIRWTGRNLFNFHCGTVALASGEIVLRQGELLSARFTIDMNRIANDDLADPAYKALLIAHLRTADFFDVEHHPTAQFVTTAAEKIDVCTPGTPNYLLRGTFTLRGISHPLAFPAVIAASDDGQSVTGQGQFEFDRTAYGSQYGSGKLFRFLGQHLVNDHIQLHVKIHAERQGQSGSI
ncbi:MAG: YceI family protein [Chthoniobacter sp.]|uniref:YceI family protein n=1 Tax=Chthoniobacter sp. TaxID=2510640 RepID=UPI0032A83DFD